MAGRKQQDGWDGEERREPAAVLVVNDESDACEMLVRLVGAAGYRTAGAHTGREALAVTTGTLPRCVVLDLRHGGTAAGLEVLDAIRQHEDERISSSRVVLCAPSAKNQVVSFQSGADAFLVRPFHLDDLVAEIADGLARPHRDRVRHRREQLARHSD